MPKNNDLETKRHSLAHILAAAVLDMFPEAKFGIGPSIENGFYYDFDLPRTLIPEDLAILEKKMREIIHSNYPFERKEISKENAIEHFKKANQNYKVELLQGIPDSKVSVYKSGPFVDLCTGPHVDSTGEIDSTSFKLSKIAGAYWKGSEKNKMLQRIYGLAFQDKKGLNEYLKMLEEAQKRDHKILGSKLELFMFDETAPGMPYWLPKGLIILNELINFWRKEHGERGYKEIKSPLINKKKLYEISGHWEHYREDMFIAKTDENEIYALKPMNCPNAMIVFDSKAHSYRDLPLRLSDTDTLHRNELSGTLNGLLRVREFSQDDAHIFITEEQITEEYERIFEITERFYSIFGMDYSFRLGTRPEKFMGDPNSWDRAESELKNILKKSKKKYFILEGDGAFYGPKVDILMKDSLGRDWQMGTIQLDFQIPKRFNLKYVDKDGKEKSPVVIHRVIYGSLERFIGILIEHFGGALPLWLSPVQVSILTISEKHVKYGEKIKKELEKRDIRADLDSENESVGKKIRQAELQKIPYIVVIGDKEMKSKKVAVRERGDKKIKVMSVEKFIAKLEKEIKNKN